jgi:CheY-like chemotaxis protein
MMRARSANCWGVEWVRTNCSSTSRWSGTSARGLRPQIKLTHEDEVLVRMPICQYLRDCGYRVLEAASVDEATHILQKQDIHVDVILSDIQMPGKMNGFRFAQWARSVRPGVDIVLAGTRIPGSCNLRCATAVRAGSDAHEALRSQDSAGPHQEAACGSGEASRELMVLRCGRAPVRSRSPLGATSRESNAISPGSPARAKHAHSAYDHN